MSDEEDLTKDEELMRYLDSYAKKLEPVPVINEKHPEINDIIAGMDTLTVSKKRPFDAEEEGDDDDDDDDDMDDGSKMFIEKNPNKRQRQNFTTIQEKYYKEMKEIVEKNLEKFKKNSVIFMSLFQNNYDFYVKLGEKISKQFPFVVRNHSNKNNTVEQNIDLILSELNRVSYVSRKTYDISCNIYDFSKIYKNFKFIPDLFMFCEQLDLFTFKELIEYHNDVAFWHA